MSRLPHVLTVVGARPQFVKAAAISRVIRQGRSVRETLVHTGQHYDHNMSEAFFAEFELDPPNHHLAVGSASHGAQTGEMMIRLERVLVEERPEVVLVYGDTNSTLAGALVAAKLDIPLAHVEAGLRSYDRSMPEEMNRVLVDHVASLLFTPSSQGTENLRREGIVGGVHEVGDVMYDVLRWQISRAVEVPRLQAAPHGDEFVLVTLHRAANTDDPERLRSVLDAFGAIAAAGLEVVWPVHPRAASLVQDFRVPGVHLIEPITHHECLRLAQAARVVATDSGGLQKEAYWLGTPCVTLRAETEWVETVEAGWNQLVDVDRDAIVKAILGATRPVERPHLYGDGHAAERIVDVLVDAVGA